MLRKKLLIIAFVAAGSLFSFAASANTCPSASPQGVGCTSGSYYCASACRSGLSWCPTWSPSTICASGLDCSNCGSADACGVCNSCNSGYRLCGAYPNSFCKANGTLPANCATYNTNCDACASCVAGYTLSGSSCVAATLKLGSSSVSGSSVVQGGADSALFVSGNKIGLGISVPTANLQINSSADTEGLRIITSNYSPFIIRNSADTADLFRIDENGNITSLGSVSGSNTYWNLNGSNLVASSTNWNVGIGTTNPLYKLYVAGGDINLDADQYIRMGGYATFTANSTRSLFGNTGYTQLRSNGVVGVTLDNSQNVGVGLTNPSAKLDVSGALKVSSSAQISLLGGSGNRMVTVDNTGVFGTAALPTTVGAGTSGQTLRHDGTSWVANSVLYNNGANVGIGTTNPSYLLDVVKSSSSGSMNVLPTINVNNVLAAQGDGSSTFNFSAFQFGAGNGAVKGLFLASYNSDTNYGNEVQFRTVTNHNMSFWTNSARRMTILNSGNVGIGMTNPGTKLDVNGTAAFGKTYQNVLTIATNASPTHYYINTKIPFTETAAPQLYITGYNYGTTNKQIKFTLGWYVYNNAFFWAQYKSDLGYYNPGNIRLGTYDDAGVTRVRIEIPNNGIYWTGFSISAFDKNGTSASYSNWTYAEGQLPGDTANITTASEFAGITYSNAGSVGIGTTNPGAKLDINGTFKVSGALNSVVLEKLSGTGSRIVMTDASGSLYATSSSVATGLPSSSTSGQTLRHDGTNWVANSILYNNGTNVGIGTTNPSYPLVVSRNATTPIIQAIGSLGAGNEIGFGVDGAGGYIQQSGATTPFRFYVNGASRFGIGYNGGVSFGSTYVGANPTLADGSAIFSGNVGIGITNPSAKLDVSGALKVSSSAQISLLGGSGNRMVTVDNTGVFGTAALPTTVGAGTSGQTLRHDGTNWVANSILYNNGTNVGIGITNPSSKLQVSGDFSLSGASKYVNEYVSPWMSINAFSASTDTAYLNFGTLLDYGHLHLEVEITGWANSTLAYGSLVKHYDIRPRNNAGTWTLEGVKSRVTQDSGYVSDTVQLGEIEVNGSSFRLPIKKVGGNEQYVIRFRAISWSGSVINNLNPSIVQPAAVSAGSREYTKINTRLGVGLAQGNQPVAPLHVVGNSYFNGNVGIGTTNPTSKLDIRGLSNAYSLRILSSDGSSFNAGIYSNSDNSAQLLLSAGASGIGVAVRGNGVSYFNGGNVGIGTTNPGAKLDVNGSIRATSATLSLLTGTGGRIVMADASGSLYATSSSVATGLPSSSTAGQTLRSDGTNWVANSTLYNNGTNIGIGTTSPIFKLDLMTGAGPFAAMRVGYPGSSLGMYLGRVSTNSYYSYIGDSYYQTGGNWRAPSTTGSAIRFKDAGGVGIFVDSGLTAGTDYVPTERLSMATNGNIGIGITNPNSLLHLYNSAANAEMDLQSVVGAGNHWALYNNLSDNGFRVWGGSDYLSILRNGNIGIGTTNPVTPLEVSRNYTGDLQALTLRNSHGSLNDKVSLVFQNTSATSTYRGSYITSERVNANAANDLYFSTSPDTSSPTEKMRITGSGNVGIGTTNPAGKLDVNGTFSIAGNNIISMPSNNPEVGPWNPIWNAIGSGKPLYFDEEFASGSNSVNVYNNSGGTAVTITRLTGQTGIPNSTGVTLKISYDGVGASSPGFGGFYQSFTPVANRTYVQRFRAKLPIGRNLVLTENSQGTNNTSYWLTNTAGTGKWEDYIRVSHAGNTGTFSNGGHVYVSGGSGAFDWYLASINVYEVNTPIISSPNTWIGAQTFSGGASFPGSGVWNSSGNVGIGLTNPSTKLDISGSLKVSGSAQISLLGGSGNRMVTVDNTGTFGTAALPTTVGAGTSGQTLRHDGTSWVANSVLYNNGANIGIGTTNPGAKLDIAGTTGELVRIASGAALSDVNYITLGNLRGFLGYDGASGNLVTLQSGNGKGISFNVSSDTFGSGPLMRLTATGNVGIGTTAPGAYKLNVAGSIYATGLTMGGDINLGGNNLSGINKLTVSTIDPLYNIKGVNYSTFASAIVGGVKEEYVGRINIDKQLGENEYEKIVDFDKLEKGSDLWVWRQVVDFSPENIQVLITPYGNFASAYYEISDNRLIFKADRPASISYRLIGKRFDWQSWPTKARDQQEKAGLIIH